MTLRGDFGRPVDAFTPEREARLARIEAAPDAEESWAVRQRAADLLRDWAYEHLVTRCRCQHLASYHQPDRRLCLGSPVCGCAEFRPDTRIQPQHRDDRHDDLEPRMRSDMGAHRVDVFPEPWEVTE